MYYKTLIFIIVVFCALNITSCSIAHRVLYHPDIYQGNYLFPEDISKINLGMTKQQVVYILGSPMMTDPFGTNTWFYVYCQHLCHKNAKQQILTLTFNNVGLLINIDNKSH